MASGYPVLIVDDEAPVRRLLRRWAEAEGVEVLEAGTAEQGAEVGSAVALAVAFCDYRLPGNDGLWLARQLREQQCNAAVIMATGVIDADVVTGGLQAGAIDYLIKPFTRERVSTALRWALHTHATRNRIARMTETDVEFERTAASNVSAILAVIREHYPAAHEHARRVAHLARQLGLALGVMEPKLSEIDRAALLHDVESLTLTEPAIGTALDWPSILQLPHLCGAVAIATGMHQPYLSDEPVPFGSQIVRVADAYDELMFGTDRPETASRAIEVLSSERVLEYDPDVLRALRTVQRTVPAA